METIDSQSPDTSTDLPAASGQSPLPPPGEKRRIELHRRQAIIHSNRIDIRPSSLTIVPPLFGFALGLGCAGLIVLGVTSNAIPYLLLMFLLLIALILVPLSGITLIYALFGANVVFDREKQSGAWQQGFLGMGIGTTELVPFWKIDHIAVSEAGDHSETARGRTEELAQWEAVLVKKSGKRLPIAGWPVPREFTRAGIVPVRELAEAIAALTGAPLDLSAPERALAELQPEADPEPEPERSGPGHLKESRPRPTGVTPHRRRRRHR